MSLFFESTVALKKTGGDHKVFFNKLLWFWSWKPNFTHNIEMLESSTHYFSNWPLSIGSNWCNNKLI